MAENVLGIDFGTSFCTMCACNAETGKPEVIRDENGDEKIPSVVYWGPDGDVKVGRAAMDILEDSALMDDERRAAVRGRIILSVKRRFRPDAPITLSGGETVYPVDVAARILKYLKENAERLYFHSEVKSVRLTHPVCFSAAQRRLLREAGEKAGFAEIELLEEPVAAAMGYAASFGKEVGKGILVYDLGGGTLDLAFVARDGEGGFRVPVAPCGDAACGGDDLDRLVYEYVDASLKQQGLGGLEEAGTGVDLAALFECRKLKESLSRLETAQMGLYIGGKRRAVALTRVEFNQLIGGLVAKSAELVDGLLKRVKAAGHTVDAVILIGGSSRIPLVRETLAKVLPVKPLEIMHGDDAVARGAASSNTLNPCDDAIWIHNCEKLNNEISFIIMKGSALFVEKCTRLREFNQRKEICKMTGEDKKIAFIKEYILCLKHMWFEMTTQLHLTETLDFNQTIEYIDRAITIKFVPCSWATWLFWMAVGLFLILFLDIGSGYRIVGLIGFMCALTQCPSTVVTTQEDLIPNEIRGYLQKDVEAYQKHFVHLFRNDA